MAKISNTISPAPGVINKLVFVIYKTTDPGAEVARIVKDPPHVVPYNFQFNDIESGIYIVKVHESPDGVILGNLRHDYWVDSETETMSSEDRLFFSVDGPGEHDPADGATDYVNPDLDGVNITGVFMEGFRYLIPGTEWEDLPGGGIRILNGVFNNGQVWAVEIQNQEIGTGTPQPNDTFSEIVIVTAASLNMTNSDLNKTLLGRTNANNVQDLNMPFIGAIANGRGLSVCHDRGLSVNVSLNAQAGEFFRFRGRDESVIHLGKGEFVKLFKRTIGAETRWYVTDYSGAWQTLGDLIMSDEDTGDNRIYLDGTEYDLSVYRRLAQYVNRLQPAQRKTYAQYNIQQNINGRLVYINRGFFAVDTVNNKVKVPDLRDKYIKFLAPVDPDRIQNIQGGYQDFQVGAVSGNLTLTLGNSFTGNPGGGWSGRPGKGESNPSDQTYPISLNANKENDVVNIAKLPMLQI